MNRPNSYALASHRAALDGAAALNLIGLAGISLALLIAFYYQLVKNELPCPLCLLQRIGLIAIGFGFLLNLRFGERSLHYGVALLGCLLTGAIAARQVLLHIVPGTGTYGSALFGLHFYTLALLAAIAAVAYVALLLMLRTRREASPAPMGAAARTVAVLFTILIAANLVSTVLECGAGQCDDDPTYYQLLGK